MDRRNFIRAAAGAATLAGVQGFSFAARAALSPARIRLGYLASPGFISDEKIVPGGWKPAADVARQLLAVPVDLLLASGEKPCPKGWDGFPEPLTSTGCGADGKSDQFLLVRLAGKPEPRRLSNLAALKEAIAGGDGAGLVIACDADLLDPIPGPAARAVADLVTASPAVVLVLCPGAACEAKFIGSALCVSTPPAASYPCAGRRIDLDISEAGVRAEVSLLQSRTLTAVESVFLAAKPAGISLSRLGSREARAFTVAGGSLTPVRYPPNPSLAPWPSDDSTLDLALIADSHIVLDKFIDDHDRKVFKLIGHSLEKESHALLRDIVGQINEGRHRVEFYDKVFAKDPEADRNYLERPIDGVLFLGDQTEDGKFEETEAFRDLARGLSDRLRPRTYVVPGNHDYWEAGLEANPGYRDIFCDCLSEFGLKAGQENYIVPLSDWCTLVMLDTVIAGVSAMGLMQERIDWLADLVAREKGKVLLFAAHHDFYPLSTVPPALYSYLRGHSHFTGEKSATRMQLHRLFAANNCAKICLSGHMHSVVADLWPKDAGVGDAATLHLQTPCVTEYPCGYRLLRLQREGGAVRAEYHTAYTRLAEIRHASSNATGYRLTGTKPRPLPGYKDTMYALANQPRLFGEFTRPDVYNLVDLNMRGFKDGTTNNGKGRGGLVNIGDRVVFQL